jgi:Tfp pilus assembly protein PilW
MQKVAYLTSTTRPDRAGRSSRTGTRAFTLVEVMVAASLGSFILAGVLTTFVMIGRVITNAGNYSDLDSDARQGLESFGREVRSAESVATYSNTSVTLNFPDLTNTLGAVLYTVTYSIGPDNENPAQNALVRTGPPLANPSGGSQTTYLVHNVSNFRIYYYTFPTLNGNNYGNGGQSNFASSATTIKQIELTLTAQRSNNTVVTANDVVLSACFTLRNHPPP